MNCEWEILERVGIDKYDKYRPGKILGLENVEGEKDDGIAVESGICGWRQLVMEIILQLPAFRQII